MYTDPQGTPLAEADASGNITARFEYTPYGVSVPSMGAAPNGVGYTGHVNDPESGFVYMQARYYDAAMGRFLSVDPVKPVPGKGFNFNRYNYANNNPYRFIDPNGQAPQEPLLAQLTVARNYIRSGYEKMMITVGRLVLNQSRRTSVALNGTAVMGTGLVASKGVYNSNDSLGFAYVAGVGKEVSLDAKYRLFTFNFASNAKDAPIEMTAHASTHFGYLGFGGEAVYNTSGSLSGYLSFGPGIGDAFYVGSVNYLIGGDDNDSSGQKGESYVERKQREMMDEEYLRQQLGFGRENYDYLQRK
ncbi:wall-associated protein [Rhodanobacter thiooxydans LCS2]|nr:wall-associated protein [Rhodanobacter thiooxydans LCS2]